MSASRLPSSLGPALYAEAAAFAFALESTGPGQALHWCSTAAGLSSRSPNPSIRFLLSSNFSCHCIHTIAYLIQPPVYVGNDSVIFGIPVIFPFYVIPYLLYKMQDFGDSRNVSFSPVVSEMSDATHPLS